MKILKTLKWHLFFSVAIIGSSLLLFGCGNDSAPLDYLYEDPGGDELPLQLDRVSDLSKDVTTVSQLVDATSGATIDFELCGAQHQLVVKQNSIPTSQVIEISAWLGTSNGHGVLLLEFSPDGLQFVPHASLCIDAAAIFGKKSSLGLHWYNPATAKWELQERITVNKGNVPFRIYHFSKYAIS